MKKKILSSISILLFQGVLFFLSLYPYQNGLLPTRNFPETHVVVKKIPDRLEKRKKTVLGYSNRAYLILERRERRRRRYRDDDDK